jgi:AraC family transcriptional regulator of adaptative response / DNA-3-methyladenine glycosylase II
VTSRHLRRVFESEYGASPIEYAQTQRLLLAKRLLTDTALPVTEVAHASGFASVRRFNALFRSRYRMAPSRLRTRAEGRPAPALAFELAYRPPYDWPAMLGFLRARAVDGVERVSGDAYARTLALAHRGTAHVGTIEVRASRTRHALRLAVSPSLARAVPVVLARAKHAFDLACDPVAVAAVLGELAAASPGLRVPGTFDGFELAVRAVVGQQVSVRAARTLLGRLVAAFGEPMTGGREGVVVLFPTAERLAHADPRAVAAVGMPAARARSVVALACAVASGQIALVPEGDVERTIRLLEALPGVGAWTAQYVAMRALRWPDAFPEGDAVVRRVLRASHPKRALERAEAWRPWRAYAVMHLWRSAL